MNRFIKHVIDMNVSRIVGKSPTFFLPVDITFKLPIIAAVYVEHFQIQTWKLLNAPAGTVTCW